MRLRSTESAARRNRPHYRVLAAAVERAINEADPIGLLEIGAPSDELHEEFLRWFGDRIAGPREAYERPARRIWDAVLAYRQSIREHRSRWSGLQFDVARPPSPKASAPPP